VIEYSSNKLHDYLECPRRFELKYLLNRVWPAIITEPVLEMEKHIKNGTEFHLMTQQFFSGIEPVLIETQKEDPQVLNWWQSFLAYATPLLGAFCQPEISLSCKIDQTRFIGVFDLLVIDPGKKYTIIDWKTNQRKPSRNILSKHIQSRLYPLLLLESGLLRNNSMKIYPDQIEMVYWFANEPDFPESFQYSEQTYQQDKEFILNLVSEIEIKNAGEFRLTDNLKICNYCNYRSLCERGDKAGSMKDWKDIDDEYLYEEITEIDITQIGDIAF